MNEKYNVYLVSDSTGETLDRIFLALKAQFVNIDYNVHSYDREDSVQSRRSSGSSRVYGV